MTNAMNAIANQVIRNSGRSGRNAGWPYFDGTFRDFFLFLILYFNNTVTITIRIIYTRYKTTSLSFRELKNFQNTKITTFSKDSIRLA
jgi:hypothetical protein